MKPPKVIYLTENPISQEPDDRWLSNKSDETDIAYFSEENVVFALACLATSANSQLKTAGLNAKLDEEQIIEGVLNQLKGK
jgi:hypothetical protein